MIELKSMDIHVFTDFISLRKLQQNIQSCIEQQWIATHRMDNKIAFSGCTNLNVRLVFLAPSYGNTNKIIKHISIFPFIQMIKDILLDSFTIPENDIGRLEVSKANTPGNESYLQVLIYYNERTESL